jgi:hypothetical protein
MPLRAGRLEKLKREALKQAALRFDVDISVDYMRPENSPPQQAVQLLSCGMDLLVHIADNAFPSLDRRLSGVAGKWVRQTLVYHGVTGASVLAQAQPALLVAMGGRLRDSDPEEELVPLEHHARLQALMASFFPVRKPFREFLDNCLAEFKVMETHAPLAPDEPATRYEEALARGENPDDDPELGEEHRLYARDFFINTASITTFEVGLDPRDVRKMTPKLARLPELEGKKAARLRERSLQAWIEGSRPYIEYARISAADAT